MASLTDILTSLQEGVVALNSLKATLENVFPQATAMSTTVPAVAGTITFDSSLATTFIEVVASDGNTYKVAAYST